MTSPPTKVSFDIPEGVTFRGLDLQTGLVRPDGILHVLLRARSLTFAESNLIHQQQLTSEGIIFVVVSGQLNVSRDMYQGNAYQRPASVTTELLSFRKSSTVFSCTYFTSGNNVASLDMNMVNVDATTRKPVPFPPWWTEMFKDFHRRSEGPRFRGFARKTETFFKGLRVTTTTVTVQRRDQDSYNHVNIVSYLQYCMDALETYLHRNEIDCDINTGSLLLKRAQYLHLGESGAGDVLSVAFWEDTHDPKAVCYDISKLGKRVYQAKMEFYDKYVIKSKI